MDGKWGSILESAVVIDLHWRNDPGSLQVEKLSVAKYLFRTKQLLRLRFWFSQRYLTTTDIYVDFAELTRWQPCRGYLATHRGIPRGFVKNTRSSIPKG